MIDDLRRRWNETEPFSPFRPLYDLISFIKDWLVLGDSLVLARRIYNERGEPDLLFKGGQERVLTLLSLAYMRPMPARVLDHLRRAARDWGRGETCLAYIHLAFGHLNKLRDPEEAAFRLFVADEYLNIGVSARDLLDAFGLDRGPGALLEKYSPDQPRVPAGSGRQSGQWTDGGALAPPASGGTDAPATSAFDPAASIVSFWIRSHEDWIRSRLRSLTPRDYVVDHAWPKDATEVIRNDGEPVSDSDPGPNSPTQDKILFAPQRADYYAVYAAGQAIAESSYTLQLTSIWETLGHGGSYDFQRDNTTMTFMPTYMHASNYSVGVYMAGAAYSEEETVWISERFAHFFSSNAGSADQIAWIIRGWTDAHSLYWTRK